MSNRRPSTMDEDIKLLFGAASFNSVHVVKKLMKKSINLNYVSTTGGSALNIAVENNHEDMVRFLLKNGALLNNPRSKVSPLLLAIKCDLREMAGILIELGASLEIGQFDALKISPLRFTVRSLNLKMLEFLIYKGADVRAKDPQTKRTALHEVGDYLNSITHEQHTKVRVKMAKLLLKNNAEISATDENCRTPLDGAIIDNVQLSKFFIKEGAPVRRKMDNGFLVEYVLYVTNLNSPELVTMCLERGGNYFHSANVDDKFVTAYHRSLKESNPEVVKVFWKFGCPVDLPLNEPVPTGRSLDSCHIEVNKANLQLFRTQLDFFKGISDNDLDKVLSAIKRGAEPKGTSLQVTCPLHHIAATKNGDPKIARVLLEHGVPVNKVVGSVKKSALFFCLINNNLPVLNEILKFGGLFSTSDLEVLRRVKNKEVEKVMDEILKAFKLTRKGSNKVLKQIRQFLNAGNKVMAEVLMNCVDNRGRSLLNLALEKGHVKLAEKLITLRINHL